MEHSTGSPGVGRGAGTGFRYDLIVILFAAAVYLVAVLSPPSLMDDVDAVQAQIARNMLESGDWVTARLNGIAYLEKSPLVYWLMAGSYSIFGVHDWAARLPIALACIALAWLTNRMGRWAFGAREGMYAGLVMGTCIGLWLFTRILIPDVILTLTIALAMWAFLRALEEDEPRPDVWAMVFHAAIGTGLLLKGLIAAVFPIAGAGLYLLVTRQLFVRRTWQRLRPFRGVAILLLIAAPWHVMATLRNPPYFDLTPRSEPGHYHGFFWFYFLNEHVFRFLNMRHPRDYNTVARYLFWLFHLLWFFPWSAFLPGVVKLGFAPGTRAGRMRLISLCWLGFVCAFFSLSTTQEYYSMPIYPAVALLLGCAMARPNGWTKWGSIGLGAIGLVAAATVAWILSRVSGLPTPGDISNALVVQDFEAYTLSLGHMGDLTIASFAYLQTPLRVAGVAFLVLAVAGWRRSFIGIAVAMVLFLNVARLAMVTFDPYLSSRPLAEALKMAPAGRLIVDNQYYTFSSVFFYASERAKGALLLNGRVNNLEYGSYAPGAPAVFLDDAGLGKVWRGAERYYLLLERPQLERVVRVTGGVRIVAVAGGKYLVVNGGG